ncbi:MAG: ATP-binding cassette domain-containing protein [bacterium]|nr:ATP-binding cassette domain-containing protein [bacterium]
MIRFLNVSLEHAQRRGIDNVTFSIAKGEFVVLAGPTGAGKTTILRLIYQELFPDSGQVMIQGQFQHKVSSKERAIKRREIGIVFPEARLLHDRTIFDNIALPLYITGETRRRIQLQVNRLLFRFGLKDRGKAYPAELSTGEQKKVAIARALAVRPLILLADEPLAHIDGEACAEILEHLCQIKEEGMTILAATHVADPYKSIANRILQIINGRLTE